MFNLKPTVVEVWSAAAAAVVVVVLVVVVVVVIVVVVVTPKPPYLRTKISTFYHMSVLLYFNIF